ncbi:hypothetical protein WNY58_14175 [Neptuniibacter pectenicola]|uniref:Uncharacterized protein n=1 Tax=Neptuniibacter pectenicola TaxID=1806669 RepID=A0ABU9TUZ3_9GAMM
MNMAISIIALLISVASLAFTYYQYRRTHRINVLDKRNEVFKKAYALRENVEDMLILFKTTDDIEEHEGPFLAIAESLEELFKGVLDRDDLTINEVYMVERRLIDLELQHSLLGKSVHYLIGYNEELKAAGYSPLTNVGKGRS